MQGFRNFKDQIGNNHSQPQNNTVSIRWCSSSSSPKHWTPACKEEMKVWNTSILVLSKHRKAVFIFMIITTQWDKDYTSRPSPNRNRLLQPCLSGGETWGWGRGRLVPINTQQLTEPGEGGNPEKQSNQPRKTEHTKHNPKKIQSQERKHQPKIK